MDKYLVTANDNGTEHYSGTDVGRYVDEGHISGLIPENKWEEHGQLLDRSSELIQVSEGSVVRPGVKIEIVQNSAQIPPSGGDAPSIHGIGQRGGKRGGKCGGKRGSGGGSKLPPKFMGKLINKLPMYLLLLLWLLGVAAIARFAGSPNDSTLVGDNLAWAGGGLGLLSLMLSSSAKTRGGKISNSLGLAGICVCFGALILYYIQTSGTSISIEHLILGVTVGTLVLAWMWQTSFFLHLSLISAIGWSGYSFMNAEISPMVWLFPALWSLQMFLAMEFKIKRSTSLTLLSGVLWIGANSYLLASTL